MARDGRDKRFLGKIRLPTLGNRDRKVKPAEDNASVNESIEGVEHKPTQREKRKMKKVEDARMKAIDKDNRRIKRRMIRKQVRKDIVQTTSESCATFCFVFVVGSTLLGGGTALIVSGKENDVFDFVVVGATGLVCGIIFTVTGLFLFIKPLYDKHKERKTTQIDNWKDQGQEAPTKPYINQEHALKLKSQIDDVKRQKRRPSHSDLYYGDGTSFDNVNTLTTPRDDSFTSYANPPFLAVPNNEKESFTKNPVLLLDAKEDPTTPKKAKSSKNTTSSVSNESASVSHVDEREEKHVSFSKDNDGIEYNGDKLHEPNSYEKLSPSDQVSSKKNLENDSCYDKVLKHASKNTIIIDYSLLGDLKTPPQTPKAAKRDERDAASDRHQIKAELEATNQKHSTTEKVEGPDQSDLTEKLYEEYPEVAEKHNRKRYKKQRRHSAQRVTHQSHSDIIVPLDDSEMDDAESIC